MEVDTEELLTKKSKKSYGRKSRYGRYPRISPYIARYLRQAYTPYTLRGLYFPNSIRNYGSYGPYGYSNIGYGRQTVYGAFNPTYGQSNVGYPYGSSYSQQAYPQQSTYPQHPAYTQQP